MGDRFCNISTQCSSPHILRAKLASPIRKEVRKGERGDGNFKEHKRELTILKLLFTEFMQFPSSEEQGNQVIVTYQPLCSLKEHFRQAAPRRATATDRAFSVYGLSVRLCEKSRVTRTALFC